MKKGFVYIMSISDRQGIVKIGRTQKHPEVRAEQLSNQTASTGEFKLEWFEEISDEVFMESFLHYVFKEFNLKKEYYTIDIDLAIEIAKDSIVYFKEMEKKMKVYYFDKIEFIEKRKKALEISIKHNKKNDVEFVKNRIDSLAKQLDQIKKLSKNHLGF